MRSLAKPLLVVVLVLLIPVVPFLLFGSRLEAWIGAWFDPPQSRPAIAAMVVALLASDILLPIPSSAVSTFGGAQLGALAGTAASWLGLTIGATIGFALARWLGQPLAERLAGPADLARARRLTDRYGPWVIVFTRALPVLAEASVLLLGGMGLAWRRFWIPTVASNLGIAIAYSVFGQLAAQYELLPVALAISIALPLLAATMVRRWLPADDSSPLELPPSEPPTDHG